MTDLTRRSLATAAVAALAPSLVRAAPDPLAFVHPQLRPAARQMQARPTVEFTTATLPTIRKNSNTVVRPFLDTVPVSKRMIPGPRGAPEVLVFVINAWPGAARPGILHMHGGGFVGGSAANSVRKMQDVALALDCAVVTVEYRLAPETTYAGSVEDNYAALTWLRDNAGELGVDTARLAVMGESAGGCHAALLAIAARDRGEIPLVYQCLTYPCLDDRTGSTRQLPAPIGTVGWGASSNRFAWESFIGQRAGARGAPGGVPARIASLKGLPPAFIGVGGIDLLVREDIEYAQRLIEAGVATELVVVPGAYHGFDNNAEAEVSNAFVATRLAALKRAFTA